ncbi:MAG: hypothetical protein UY26_C0003G0021 [Candidatus Jorgensenbacteria bacterium GW2011_GWA1_48_13]|uniref:Uncharacterized protein n=2 Tax=Candidatus Joergenseniibacteriota TaxID=1752739 RepID=A0A0G1YJ14_9BACT|nr:MAG: hypothetical protein UY26_C0003G0021 [Candidatus Jorgensenbacteria bacterium GW2011_GWA1_48_13]KKU99302.1 MAG: hypothetical protein UY32_C0002G0038 [Candidatus Jorgensenbacteria bacterium GW2011_GWC1_48_8]KKW14982.1 MAG: hypothetical protein UY55_C0002G0038 [Candidatus Jorgensenbacteria bacterium GW2011_GWB1_50_10]
MKYGELTLGQVEAMVNKVGGMDGVKRLLAGELAVGPKWEVESVFRIDCWGDQTASELVRLGQYDRVNDFVTDERFPLVRHDPEERVVELIKLANKSTSEEVLRELEVRGLARPTAEDALYFGRKYLREQQKRPIVFLHEPVLVPGGDRVVLVLGGYASRRNLDLLWFGYRWDRFYAFAGVHKK